MLRAISNFFAAVNTWTQKNIFNPGPVLIGTATDDGVNKLQVNGTLAFGTANDAVLQRDAANVLAQRNGTNAQAFRLYNTFTDASNYERGSLDWSAGILTLRTAMAGTGSATNLRLQTDGNASINFFTNSENRCSITNTGSLVWDTDNAQDIGASGANRPRSLYLGTGLGGKSGAAAPTASDIPASQWMLWKNTTDATVKLYYNDAGTLKSVALT